MWTKLRNCKAGDMIKAVFLGNPDPADSSDKNWHTIYKIEAKSKGQYYVAAEGWGGRYVDGDEDVYKM